MGVARFKDVGQCLSELGLSSTRLGATDMSPDLQHSISVQKRDQHVFIQRRLLHEAFLPGSTHQKRIGFPRRSKVILKRDFRVEDLNVSIIDESIKEFDDPTAWLNSPID